MSFWLGVFAILLCCFSAVLLVSVCCGKASSAEECLCAGGSRHSESGSDDTRKAVREKLEIRREMPPEVLEHMARVYDLPHGASPACGMSACSTENARRHKSRSFSFSDFIDLLKEYSSSENDPNTGVPDFLLAKAKTRTLPLNPAEHPKHSHDTFR